MTASEIRPVPGAAVVCLRGDEVLLVRRGREPNLGRWSFPGGRVEPGETARQAAARETVEETGIRVRVLDVVDVYDAIFPPFHYCVADYLAVPEDEHDPSPSGDAMDARWVPFSQLQGYELTEAMRQVLDRARWLSSVRQDAPPPLGMDLDPVAPPGITPHASARDRLRGLYVITDDRLRPGRSHLDIARAAVVGGARVVQLRDKRRDAAELLGIARRVGEVCRAAGVLFVVNDRVDVACAAGAGGVHLGQADLPVAAARAILGPDAVIGISVESPEQAFAAEAGGADYLGVGAIYGSGTKDDAGEAVGLAQISRMRSVSSLPIVAIGGITRERATEVIAAGADAVAVISAVAVADDPEATARALAAACTRA